MVADSEYPIGELVRTNYDAPSFQYDHRTPPKLQEELEQDRLWLTATPESNLLIIMELKANPHLAKKHASIERLINPANKYSFDEATEDEIEKNAEILRVKGDTINSKGTTALHAVERLRTVRLELYLRRHIRLSKMGGTILQASE